MSRIGEIYETGELFDGRYKLIDLLSTSGGSADVWLALDLNTIDDISMEDKATKVVIKVYRPKNIIDIEGEYQFRNEFKKVFNCHHENIIQPTYFSIYEGMPYLVLPYCPEGSSEMLIGKIQDKDNLWKYLYEVACGLSYLHNHSPQIIHQDIKPANVLIDDNGHYAITDFGISAALGESDFYSEDESGGTFAYMAPERFNIESNPMPESDIWALGATIYELITGDTPFGNDGGKIQTQTTLIPLIKEDIPESLKHLIYSCLSYNTQDRPSANEIVDLVLKKKYDRGIKRIFIIIVSAIIVTIGIVVIISSTEDSNQDAYFKSLIVSADSIIHNQAEIINRNNSVPTLDNISELKKANVLLNKVIKDSPVESTNKELAENRINTLNQLIDKIEEYDFTYRLVENARITEMEDSVIKYSLVLENQKQSINKLIRDFR